MTKKIYHLLLSGAWWEVADEADREVWEGEAGLTSTHGEGAPQWA